MPEDLRADAGKAAKELCGVARDKARSATNVLVLWLIALLVLWVNEIVPQLFDVSAFARYRDVVSGGSFDLATARDVAAGFRNLPIARVIDNDNEHGSEENGAPQRKGAFRQRDRGKALNEHDVRANLWAQASTLTTKGEFQDLGKDVLRRIAYEPIELPLGLKLKSVRNTLIPLLWCVVCVALLSYLLLVRSRCHTIIARALRILEEQPRLEIVDDQSQSRASCVDSLMLDLPWWLHPLPARSGDKVTAAQFHAAVSGGARSLSATASRLGAMVLLAATFISALYASWWSTVLIDQEVRFELYPLIDRTIFDVALYEYEIFAIREGSLIVLALGLIWMLSWFRSRAVPDGMTVDGRGRRLLLQLTVVGLGLSFLPLRNIARSFVRPVGSSSGRNPRFRDKTRKRKSPSLAYRVESDVETRLARGLITPKQAFQQLQTALTQTPRSLRLYDRMAALTVQYGLSGERNRLLMIADQTLTTKDRTSKRMFQPAGSKRRASGGSDGRPRDRVSPSALPTISASESLPHSASTATGESPSAGFHSRRGLFRMIVTGDARLGRQTPEKLAGKRSHRFKNGKCVLRLRKRSHPSFEVSLDIRRNRWRDPEKRWITKWTAGSARAERGWLLPKAASGKPPCPAG